MCPVCSVRLHCELVCLCVCAFGLCTITCVCACVFVCVCLCARSCSHMSMHSHTDTDARAKHSPFVIHVFIFFSSCTSLRQLIRVLSLLFLCLGQMCKCHLGSSAKHKRHPHSHLVRWSLDGHTILRSFLVILASSSGLWCARKKDQRSLFCSSTRKPSGRNLTFLAHNLRGA